MTWAAIIVGILVILIIAPLVVGHFCAGIQDVEREIERGIDARYPYAANDDDSNYLRVVRS